LLDPQAYFRYIFVYENMANTARELAESALRARKLDRTLTSALPPFEGVEACAPTRVAPLDGILRGGLPRGQLCELVGLASSGRTTLLLQIVAAATARGELAAVIDTCDRLDVASAVAAGVDLDRVLWIRGRLSERPAHGAWLASEHALDRALKALNLVLQAGAIGVVAIDLADVPPALLKRLPFTTWLRVQRAIEGRDTVGVLVASEPVARSAGGLTLSLSGRALWAGVSDPGRRLERLDITTRVISPRRRVDGEVAVRALA
jgi:recombination protein RecA